MLNCISGRPKMKLILRTYVAVPSRNGTLFYCVYISTALPWSNCCSTELLLWAELICTRLVPRLSWLARRALEQGLHRLIRYSCTYNARINLNRNFVLQRSNSNVVEIHTRIIFGFYPGLPHTYICLRPSTLSEAVFYSFGQGILLCKKKKN